MSINKIETNSSSAFPLTDEATAPPPPPASARTLSTMKNELERGRAMGNNFQASTPGLALEGLLFSQLKDLPEGTTRGLSLSGEIAAKYAGQLNAKVDARREPDGSYSVGVAGGVGVGLGLQLFGTGAKAVIAGETKVTFKFGSAEEAADKLAALLQLGAQSAPNLAGQAAALLLDDNAEQRARAAFGQISKVKLELGAEATAGVKLPGVELKGSDLARAGLAFGGKTTVEYDADKRTLTTEQRLQTKAELKFGLGDLHALVPKALTGAELQNSLALRTTYDFGGQRLGQLFGAGSVGAALEGLEQLHRPELVSRTTIKGAGIKAELEHAVRLDQGLEAIRRDALAFPTDVRCTGALITDSSARLEGGFGSLSVASHSERSLEVQVGSPQQIFGWLEFQVTESRALAAAASLARLTAPGR